MLTAIFALAGVVLGGAITWVAQTRHQRRLEQRELRVAKRLLEDEVLVAIALVSAAEEDDPEARVVEANLGQILRDMGSLEQIWTTHRGVLAAEMGQQDWHQLRRAVRLLSETATQPTQPDRESLRERLGELERIQRLLSC
jgi:hypothetical protein